MPKISQMQGVPAHLETLKSNGIRRHPAHCIFAKGKGASRSCTSPLSPFYLQHCSSAAKCDFYKPKTNKK